MNVSARRFWLSSAPEPIAASWFWQTSATAPRAGVVIVGGFAHEERTMATGLAVLAERLAVGGWPSLLIELPGTAQSGSTLDAPDIVAQWTSGVRAAVAHARSTGLEQVVVIGVRTGALVAACALADDHAGAAASGLVSWGGVDSGRRYGRELRLLQVMSNDLAATGEIDGQGSPAASDIEIVGFVIPAATTKALGRLNVGGLDRAPAPRVLVIDAPERQHDDTVEHLRSLGAEVDEHTSTATERWLYETMDGSDVPLEDIAFVGDWIGRLTAGFAPTAATLDRIDLPAARTYEHEGRTIRESLLVFGPDRLHGVLTEPVDPCPAEAAAPVRVLASSVGPGRAFVEFARDQAAAGRSTVRFDMSGFGGSPRREGGVWNGHYDVAGSADIREAIAVARGAHGREVVLIGFCASAWSVLQAGPSEGLVAVVAMNVHLYIRDHRYSVLNGPPANWLERQFDQRTQRNMRPRIFHYLYRRFPLPAAATKWMRALLAAGVRVHMIFDEHDAGHVFLTTRSPHRWDAARASGQLTVTTYPALGHHMEGAADRARMMVDLVETLAGIDARRPQPPALSTGASPTAHAAV